MRDGTPDAKLRPAAAAWDELASFFARSPHAAAAPNLAPGVEVLRQSTPGAKLGAAAALGDLAKNDASSPHAAAAGLNFASGVPSRTIAARAPKPPASRINRGTARGIRYASRVHSGDSGSVAESREIGSVAGPFAGFEIRLVIVRWIRDPSRDHSRESGSVAESFVVFAIRHEP